MSRSKKTPARIALDSLAELKNERGLSLSELEAATGIGRSNLSRLWNNPSPNVTVETLNRIASALDVTLTITFEE